MNWRYIVMRILTGCGIALFMFGVHKFARAQSIDCSSPCSITIVHEWALPPLQLDLAGGAAVGGAVITVWACAWAFRMIVRAIRDIDKGPDNGE